MFPDCVKATSDKVNMCDQELRIVLTVLEFLRCNGSFPVISSDLLGKIIVFRLYKLKIQCTADMRFL